jgi:hypothetical protein
MIILFQNEQGGLSLKAPIESEVKEILKPIESALAQIPLGAWQDLLESSEFGRIRFTRTVANLVWDRMIDRAFNAFSQNPSIGYIIRHHTVLFTMDNRVLFRFKKGDCKGLSHNFQTSLALAYHDHTIPLFGDMNLTRVEVVYVLDEMETSIDRVCIVARDGADILWAYDIKSKDGAGEVSPMPPPARIPPERLVTPRHAEKETPQKKNKKVD